MALTLLLCCLQEAQAGQDSSFSWGGRERWFPLCSGPQPFPTSPSTFPPELKQSWGATWVAQSLSKPQYPLWPMLSGPHLHHRARSCPCAWQLPAASVRLCLGAFLHPHHMLGKLECGELMPLGSSPHPVTDRVYVYTPASLPLGGIIGTNGVHQVAELPGIKLQKGSAAFH